jgi:integrase
VIDFLEAPDDFLGEELDASTRQHLEPPELERFFGALDDDNFWGPYFRLQFFYGCRVSEIAILFASELSIEKRKIIIKRLKKGKNAKRPAWVEERYPPGIMPKTYTLPEVLVPELQALAEHKDASGLSANPFLFPSRRRGQVRAPSRLSYLRLAKGRDGRFYRSVDASTAHRRFKEAVEEAGIPDMKSLRRTHVLRHTRATLLYASGATAAEVQHLLGHSSEKITATYLHAAKSMKDRYDESLLHKGLEGF